MAAVPPARRRLPTTSKPAYSALNPHLELDLAENPTLPPQTDATVSAWMRKHTWTVMPARWETEPEMGFYVWEEETPAGRSHALWVEEAMVRHLTPEQLVDVLDREGVAEDIRINFKVRIEERGAEYRVSVVPRRSGEFRKQG